MTWGHICLSWPSSPMSLLASCWLKRVVATVYSNQAATHSAWSPLSLEIKQEHVELAYTPGTLLCPPQSDDGNGRAWIFTALDVNILACRPCASPVPTHVNLHESVRQRSWLCLATLSHLSSHFPIHFICELVNEQISACQRTSEKD